MYYKQWWSLDNEAQSLIMGNVSKQLMNILDRCRTARKMWLKLNAMYAGRTRANINKAYEDYHRCTQRRNQSLQTYIGYQEGLVHRLESLGEVIQEEDQIRRLLAGLLPEFNVIRTTLENMENLNYTEVTARLLSHEAMNRRTFTPQRQGYGRANQVGQQQQQQQQQQQPGDGGEPSANAARRQQGRGGNKIPSKSKGKKDNTCFACGKEGHMSYDCPDAEKGKKKVVCYYCNKEGHVKTNCPDLPDQSNPGGRGRSDRDDQEDPGRRGNKRYTAVARVLVGSHSANQVSFSGPGGRDPGKTAWIIDSGATHHMCNSGEAFKSWSSLRESVPVSLADDTVVSVERVGEVPLHMWQGAGGAQLTLGGVLYIPTLANSLFSVPRAMENGITVIFDAQEGACNLMYGRELVGTGYRQGGLWYLDGEMEQSGQTTVEDPFAALTTLWKGEHLEPLTLWHHRLGHLGEDNLLKMVRSGVVGDLPDKLTGVSVKERCLGCSEGKQHRESFGSGRLMSRRVLELVHSDVMGPVTPESIGGNKYILVIVDDYTRMCWVYPVRSKAVVGGVLLGWIDSIMVSKESRVKTLRTDNGGEFTSKEFEDGLTDRLIVHERTLPYTPQHNGVVERANRTLAEMARSMMCAAQCTRGFWGEAILAAAHIKNRTPHRSVVRRGKEITPYEAWFGRKPSVAHLKVWGCRVTVLHTLKQPKFGEKTWTGMMVGYSSPLGYRVWNPERRVVEETRNVRFQEGVNWTGVSVVTRLQEYLREDPDGDHDFSDQEEPEMTMEEMWNNFGEPYQEEPDPQPYNPDWMISAVRERGPGFVEGHEVHFQSETGGLETNPDAGVVDLGVDHPVETDSINDRASQGRYSPIYQEQVEMSQDQEGSLNGGPAERSRSPSLRRERSPREDQHLPPTPQREIQQEETMELRRSTRERRAPRKLTYDIPGEPHLYLARQGKPSKVVGSVQVNYFVGVAALESASVPQSYSEAVKGPNAKEWLQGISEEMNSLRKNQTWSLVELPKGRKALGSKWVLTIKDKADGTKRYKARLVVKGFMQEAGVDYQETFAPVIKIQSLRILLGVGNQRGMHIHQMDVKTAFLNGVLEEDIYMEQPEGFRLSGKGRRLVCKLRRSLYGLKQSPRVWNRTFNEFLVSLGFTKCLGDEATYVISGESTQLYLGVYVDDLVLMSEDMDRVNWVKEKLTQKFEMVDLGPVNTILGLKVRRDLGSGVLTLDQSKYIGQLLVKFGMEDARPLTTPMVVGDKLSREQCAQTQQERAEMKEKPYRSAIGSLMYLMVCTRPDLAAVIGVLSRFLENPGQVHWEAVKRVFRYLKLTVSWGLKFTKQSSLVLDGYVDADWGGCPDTRRSTGAYIFRLGGTAISWASKRQSSVALSSCEAEYMALSQAAKEAVWLSNFVQELGVQLGEPLNIKSDSQSALALVKNPVFHARTKHIGIHYHFVRDLVWRNQISFTFCRTDQQWADALTKSVPREKLVNCLVNCGVVDTEVNLGVEGGMLTGV